ncbi:thioesterase II family protein [Gloeobacter morelensis]|uniref:Thioesterase n=1 Tax=Gloeobacter morelensis MG652769 TaxID=2781736 RepID=A0ABY3PJJ7_9CYAN|nr:alpha/beta fold hydrolase [Gloeobacter morelensis]UFP93835.1 thioesterase [Gloeobacter morelensis MG652769]
MAVSSKWVVFPRPNPRARLRLFCFPYAGGAAHVFRNWPSRLPESLEVGALELPGHGGRLAEAPFTELPPLVRAAAAALAPYQDRPVALFGHSMGALIAFELARMLKREHNLAPVHLFVSARRAPQMATDADAVQLHRLPAQELIERLRRLNGTPRAALADAELMELLLPTLRADFAVCETYRYTSETLLPCPITVFGGLQDPEVSLSELEGWREQTKAAFARYLLPGDHFFLHTSQILLLQALQQQLHEAGL